MRAIFILGRCLLVLLCATSSLTAEISFNRDIRPLLSDRCFKCHGPDGGKHGEMWKGGLRLDLEETSFADLNAAIYKVETAKRTAQGKVPLAPPTESRFAIVQGKPEESVLIQRIMTDDPDELMPPKDSHLSLSAKEKELLRRWVEEGAQWDGHWSFDAPEIPAFPEVSMPQWPITEIDHFVLARLDAKNIEPAEEASRVSWLRRVTQDLRGLPPTLEEIDAFSKDRAEDAYAKVVDRLLDSSDYAERMTTVWLDNARYADSNGYQFDNERSMWPWRDWVIQAFRDNMPFNQFVTEQLAGDLLPEPTEAQRIATGFNRNHGYSIEGGIIDEEYRVTYANDKTTTFGTLFLGLTMDCTRCHDHKYDPLTMRDFYSLSAFFNTSAEVGAPGKKGLEEKAAPPFIRYKSPKYEPNLIPAPEDWEGVQPQSVRAEQQTLSVQGDASILASGVNPEKDRYVITLKPKLNVIRSVRLEALIDPSMTDGQLARSSSGNFVLTDFRLTLVEGDERKVLPVIKVFASHSQSGFPVSESIDKDPENSGWAVFPKQDKDQFAEYLLKKNCYIPEDAVIEAELAFSSKHAKHHIGRFRLSVSGHDEVSSKVHDKSFLVMVMDEKPRKSYILKQGLFDQPGDEVSPDTPAVLSSFEGYAENRLGLAKWLFTAENPLFARVTVNRIWHQLFGIGLVKSVDNFGIQGEQPSHPYLLDWLAVDFREHGWDLHHLIRKIVLSATYRQSSVSRPELSDPDNRSLARGPRFRLPAEMIRDQALAVSGLLSQQVGGPSVMPYQPAGVWEDLNAPKSHAEIYHESTGESLYRKSLYSYWRRAALHPAMAAFDAPNRDVCSVSRELTNTPLQALVTLHGPTYIESSRHLAENYVEQEEAVARVFEVILSRKPTASELNLLEGLHDTRLEHYRNQPEAVTQLFNVGASEADSNLNPAAVAALADTCHVILNLSETITRN